jgi:GntR family transcriptional repressor for pyruvate dehydrogenase complex
MDAGREQTIEASTGLDSRAARRGAVADKAVRTLVEMINIGRFPPESRLPAQRPLAEQLRISRASLREATLVLETLGYVRVEPNRGTFVCPHREREMRSRWRFADRYSERDIFETRYTLEGYTARLAALRASDEDIAALRSRIEGMKRAARERDLVGFAEMDFAFHHHLVRMSDNQVVAQTLRILKEAMKESQRLPLADISGLWEPIHEHERIVEAIRQHDPDGAAYLMQLHITRAAHRAKISLRI